MFIVRGLAGTMGAAKKPARNLNIEMKPGADLLAYVKRHEPRAWRAIVARVPMAALAVSKAGEGMQGLGLGQDDVIDAALTEGAAASAAPAGIDWGGIVTQAVTAGSGLMQLMNNQTIFRTNLQRAQAGKPPITPAQVASMAPPMRAAATVGLDTKTRATVSMIAVGAGVLAAGLGVLFIFRRPAHHRKFM